MDRLWADYPFLRVVEGLKPTAIDGYVSLVGQSVKNVQSGFRSSGTVMHATLPDTVLRPATDLVLFLRLNESFLLCGITREDSLRSPVSCLVTPGWRICWAAEGLLSPP
jgi:hypothetical protein